MELRGSAKKKWFASVRTSVHIESRRQVGRDATTSIATLHDAVARLVVSTTVGRTTSREIVIRSWYNQEYLKHSTMVFYGILNCSFLMLDSAWLSLTQLDSPLPVVEPLLLELLHQGQLVASARPLAGWRVACCSMLQHVAANSEPLYMCSTCRQLEIGKEIHHTAASLEGNSFEGYQNILACNSMYSMSVSSAVFSKLFRYLMPLRKLRS